MSAVAQRARPDRAQVRRGIAERARLRRDLDRLHRGLGRHRRHEPRPSAGYAAMRNLRLQAEGAVTAIAERLHDGTRHCPPELAAAIDAGDTPTVRAIEAAWLDRELGPGTGALYLQVRRLLHHANLLEHAHLHNVGVQVLYDRIAAAQSLADDPKVTIIDGRRGDR